MKKKQKMKLTPCNQSIECFLKHGGVGYLNNNFKVLLKNFSQFVLILALNGFQVLQFQLFSYIFSRLFYKNNIDSLLAQLVDLTGIANILLIIVSLNHSFSAFKMVHHLPFFALFCYIHPKNKLKQNSIAYEQFAF